MHITLAPLILSLFTACGSEPSTPPSEPPPTPAPAAPERAEAPKGATLSLSGTIAFDGAIDAKALFVSVKDPAQPGPPLAAKQLPPGPFPMTFTLTDADVVQMGPKPRAIPANVALTVRLDADGNAMSKEPTEPIATLETPATTADLALTLAAPQ